MRSIRELEICAESLQACRAAAEGGADRIELCAALGEGGVTPSRAMIRAAMAASGIPVHVLLRPRAGNFVYSEEEFAVICEDAEDALALGAAGIVTGMLSADRQIDRVRMQELIRRMDGAPVTFHRAFDQLSHLPEQLERLIDLGCGRVLTSGGGPSVMEGVETLTQLVAQSAGRIRVAAGGGVTIENARRLCSIEGLDLHASLRRRSPDQVFEPLWVDGSIAVEDVRRLRNQVDESGSERATLVAAGYTA